MEARIKFIREIEENRNILISLNEKNTYDDLIDEFDKMLYRQYVLLSDDIKFELKIAKQLKKLNKKGTKK